MNSKMKPRSRRGGGRPTIADVAKLAGVGAITVSRALREPGHLFEDLRRQIAAAVKTLGYVPDTNARALASARANVVGVLVPSLTNNVFADVVRGIYDGLSDTDFQIQIGNTHYSGMEEERLLKVFLGQRPAALIVSGIDQTPVARRLLEGAGCPVVQIMETTPDPIDMMIGFSHLEGGRTATQHLIDVGYRRIGFVGAHGSAFAAPPGRLSRRDRGCRPVRPAFGDHHVDPLKPVPRSLLLRDALAKTPNLDAVFCNNDDLALGVCYATGPSSRCRRPSALPASTTSTSCRQPFPR